MVSDRFGSPRKSINYCQFSIGERTINQNAAFGLARARQTEKFPGSDWGVPVSYGDKP
jgi:hypothetical protein